MKSRSFMKHISVALVAIFGCVMMTTASAAFSPKNPIKVGFLYVSPIADGGWSYQQDLGRRYLDRALGHEVKTFYAENIPEAGSARVIRRMAATGTDLIFTTSFGYMNPTFQVAKKFPDVIFMHCSGYKRRANMGTYMARVYQGRYLSGMVAGMMTESNKLGFVAAHPIPEVFRAIDAFTLGARAVNPKATVHVIWINAWYDPQKAREATKTLIDQGADVITHHTDSHAVVQAAAELGVYSIGYDSDYSDYGGKYQLTAVVEHWGPFFVKVAKRVLNGTWKSKAVWNGLKQGMVALAPLSPVIPQKVKQRVLEAKRAIVAGKLNVFAGPIVSKKGKTTVPKGQVMSDKAILSLSYYVKGVASPPPVN